MAGTLRAVGDLFDGYGASARGLTEAAFDEMVGHDGAARVPYAGVASSLAQMGPEDVSARASRLARAFMDQGVTFDLDGEERPFPLDVVPRIFTGPNGPRWRPAWPSGCGPSSSSWTTSTAPPASSATG